VLPVTLSFPCLDFFLAPRRSRFIVTNLAGLPKALSEKLYCAEVQLVRIDQVLGLALTNDPG